MSGPPEIPRLDTERLILRGHRLADFDDCVAMWSDPVVTRYIGGKPSTREDVWARLLRYIGHWAMCGHGFWVVEDRATGRFAGEVGVAEFRREMSPPLDGVPECGWGLARWCHGRGYATEAVIAALDWTDRHLHAAETAALIDPGNEASIKVAARCGYRDPLPAIYKGDPSLVFRRPRSQRVA